MVYYMENTNAQHPIKQEANVRAKYDPITKSTIVQT